MIDIRCGWIMGTMRILCITLSRRNRTEREDSKYVWTGASGHSVAQWLKMQDLGVA